MHRCAHRQVKWHTRHHGHCSVRRIRRCIAYFSFTSRQAMWPEDSEKELVLNAIACDLVSLGIVGHLCHHCRPFPCRLFHPSRFATLAIFATYAAFARLPLPPSPPSHLCYFDVWKRFEVPETDLSCTWTMQRLWVVVITASVCSNGQRVLPCSINPVQVRILPRAVHTVFWGHFASGQVSDANIEFQDRAPPFYTSLSSLLQ